jgi:hypothetical protein
VAQLTLPAPPPLAHLDPTSPNPEAADAVDQTIRYLLSTSTLTNNPSIPPYPAEGTGGHIWEEAAREDEEVYEDKAEYLDGLVFDQTPYKSLSQQIGEGGLDMLNEDLSDEELQERPEAGENENPGKLI